jgi:NAD+ synthase
VEEAVSTMTCDVLSIDASAETEQIATAIRRLILQRMRRRGAVIGLSGGIDSSVVAALCVRALGSDRVLGLLMPDRDSSPDSIRLGELLAASLGIRTVLHDITPALNALGCYHLRDEAIRSLVPDYGPGDTCKLVVPNVTTGAQYSAASVVVQSSDGPEQRVRLTSEAYLQIVAATNFKQRTRKMLEYYRADCLQYAVAGTPNRLEYALGFFVKNGDGAADLKPIAHLYKSQVYQLAEYLQVPREIVDRPPTTDTFPMEQSQEEFFFALPLRQMDYCLYGKEHNLPAAEIAKAIDLTEKQVESVYRAIASKQRATEYMHLPPLFADASQEISNCGPAIAALAEE